jgi:REP element-mobilizing transposase RayT
MMQVRLRKTRARQQRIEFCGHGGKRRGAGRKRRGGRRRVPHRRRPHLDGRTPVHVTLRVAAHVPSLRNYERCKELRKALCKSASQEGFRICHFTVQGNHLHLVCEAASNRALARGMQTFEQRVTRALNALLGRKGTVWADRYHFEPLRTPRQVRAALSYALNNWRKHGEAPREGVVADPFSSARYFDGWATAPATGPPQPEGDDGPPVAPAETWLLTVGWRRHGLIRLDEAPGTWRGR